MRGQRGMSTVGAVLLAATAGLLTATLMMDWMVVDVHVVDVSEHDDIHADMPIHIKVPFPLLIADIAILGGRIDRLRESLKKPRPDRDELRHELDLLTPLYEALDGGAPRRITNAPHVQHEPFWDASGRWIYFLSRESMLGHHIWRVRPDGARREALTAGSAYHFDIAVGPGGRVAFSTNRSGNYEIWVGDDVDRAKPITTHRALDSSPTFSPDGESLERRLLEFR